MASPFPGMDPYLEDSKIWPGFHHRLADEIADRLNAIIGVKYYAEVNLRTVLDEVLIAVPHLTYPDVGIVTQPLRESALALETPLEETAIAPAPVQRIAPVIEETILDRKSVG